MSSTKQKPKPRARFHREAPEDRRRQLGEAALRCSRRHGNAGVSVRQIAAEAGVTQGLITHHFGEINELVAYAFDIMSEDLLKEILNAVEAAQPTPQARLEAFIAAGKSIALVCHAPGVLHRVKNPDGTPFVNGRKVTGFTNSEEAAVGLTEVVPFLVEDELLGLGAVFSKVKDWGVHTVVDGRLITGQNPASSGETAKALLAALKP